MVLSTKIAKRDAERLKEITMAIRMMGESALRQYELVNNAEDNAHVRQSIFFWNSAINSINWIDSIIDSRTME